MVSFTATYTSATGQPRTVTVKANDAVAARRLLRRRGIKAEELRQDKGKGNNKAKAESKSAGKSSSAGWLSMDLGEAFQKPPGVKE
ncbi:MAG: type II secretion system F family protein, partial [Cyanobacteria bacterium]|nr:type II secretion system F family protein [Cyanobacteriota bacterium]